MGRSESNEKKAYADEMRRYESEADDVIDLRSAQREDEEEEDDGYTDVFRDLTPAELGKLGERAALNYLDAKGFELVEKNWRCRFGEVDIVAFDEDTLVFIEVKTRSGAGKGFPEEAVSCKKRLKLERLAGYFLAVEDIQGTFSIRFDVIAVLIIAEHQAFIKHHINAFGQQS